MCVIKEILQVWKLSTLFKVAKCINQHVTLQTLPLITTSQPILLCQVTGNGIGLSYKLSIYLQDR